uniref:DUF2089 family protein n=1 Tax=Alistipes sp. TaxID=1872444 RepID=UPI0040562E40
MEKEKHLPKACPACGGALRITSLRCSECTTRIEGDFPLQVILRLPWPEQRFLMEFIRVSGSLKELAARMGLSYPTVRNRLDDILALIQEYEKEESSDH